jgi:hypothetical protein
MRTSIVMLATGVLAALSACAGPPNYMDPKGSYPDAGTGNVEVPRQGELAVITHPDVTWHAGGKDTYRYLNPAYVVYDERGRRVAEVTNRLYAAGVEEPTPTCLPEGRYLVRVNNLRHDVEPAVFWVTVSEDNLTLVDVNALHDRPGEPRPEPKVPPSE